MLTVSLKNLVQMKTSPKKARHSKPVEYVFSFCMWRIYDKYYFFIMLYSAGGGAEAATCSSSLPAQRPTYHAR